jgi:hypothetical protein
LNDWVEQFLEGGIGFGIWCIDTATAVQVLHTWNGTVDNVIWSCPSDSLSLGGDQCDGCINWVTDAVKFVVKCKAKCKVTLPPYQTIPLGHYPPYQSYHYYALSSPLSVYHYHTGSILFLSIYYHFVQFSHPPPPSAFAHVTWSRNHCINILNICSIIHTLNPILFFFALFPSHFRCKKELGHVFPTFRFCFFLSRHFGT